MLLRFGGQTVLTEVIDNKLKSAGRQFELTERLARELGLDGTQEIDWRFAASPRAERGADRVTAPRGDPRIVYDSRARPCAWPGVST